MNPETVALLYQSALGSIRAAGTGADIGAIASQLRGMITNGAQLPYAVFLNIVRSADNNWRQASVANAEPNTVPPARSVPVDPTIPPGQAAYAYRVVVTLTDGSGNKTDTLVTVRSDVSLSGDQIAAQAIQDVRDNVAESGTNHKNLPTAVSYSAVVVSAGRRR